jgi:hypothetical protein
LNRRKFIQESVFIAGTGTLLQQCKQLDKHAVTGKIAGANSTIGHLLKDPSILSAVSKDIIHTEILIIGGGVSGLSAARWLHQNSQQNFLLIELETVTGGNAASGKNDTGAYPWGAHYVPLPNNNLKEYCSFLEECNVITGYQNNLPVINEYYLCFEPQERLYINGYWQEGIIPHFGVPEEELQQVKKFLSAMEVFRLSKGADEKDAFSIPVDESSTDESFINLDKLTMKEWLEENGYTSPHLQWYVNYCCRDDFGTDYQFTSAWAGIHYFAGRKGVAANAPAQSVITWPEGNGWLATQLRKNIEKNILVNTLAIDIEHNENEVQVKVINTLNKRTQTIIAKKCIIATPQFVTSRILPDEERKKIVAGNFVYQPWMVANITTQKLEERNGAELSWDNILYNAKGLGYVEATHQMIKQLKTKNIFTYYLPLTENAGMEERTLAQKRSYEDWIEIIKQDLLPAHSNLLEKAENIDIWIWGHGMISPQKNFIHGTIKKQLQKPLNNKIFFAHTDLSGISIFEEAFYQGIKAAKAILQTA